MTPTQWSSENYPALSKALIRMTHNDPLGEDLVQEVMCVFLAHPQAQSIVDSQGALFYCLRIGMNLWNSASSPFYRTYKMRMEELIPDYDQIPDTSLREEEISAEIHNRMIKDLSWYEQMLLCEYAAHNCNASSLAKETGIPRTSIALTLKRISSHIKKKVLQ